MAENKYKEIGTALAGIVRTAVEGREVDITTSDLLRETLYGLENGEIGKLGSLTEAIIASARNGYAPVDSMGNSRLYGPEFFARDASEVARDLCGQVIAFSGHSDYFFGIVSKTGGYGAILEDDKKYATATAEPGTVGKYNSRGPVTIVSAHGLDTNGIVAIWELLLPDGSRLKMHDTSKSLQVPEHVGEVIGLNTSVYQLALGHPGLDSMLRDGRVEDLPQIVKRSGADAAYGLTFR